MKSEDGQQFVWTPVVFNDETVLLLEQRSAGCPSPLKPADCRFYTSSSFSFIIQDLMNRGLLFKLLPHLTLEREGGRDICKYRWMDGWMGVCGCTRYGNQYLLITT